MASQSGKGEDAVEPREEVDAPLLVAVDEHLSVGLGEERMPGGRELVAKLAVVVDLAVVDNGDPSIVDTMGMCPAEERSMMLRRRLPRPTAPSRRDVGAAIVGATVRVAVSIFPEPQRPPEQSCRICRTFSASLPERWCFSPSYSAEHVGQGGVALSTVKCS